MKEDNLTQEEIQALLESQAKGSEKTLEMEAKEDPGKAGLNESATEVSKDEERGGDSAETGWHRPSVRPMVFEELAREPAADVPLAGMEILLDIPLSVTVELGRTRCYVKDLLNLTQGSIIELDRLAGDPVDVLVNGKPFAKGEVVVIDENFGVRIREIVGKPATERRKNS